MIEATLTWTIECDTCHLEFKEVYRSDWFQSGFMSSDFSEEEMDGNEAIENARMQGWDFHRRSYEELVPYCPNCKES